MVREQLKALASGGVLASFVDVMANGGDIILEVALFFAENSNLLLLLSSRVRRLAPSVAWIDAATVDQVLLAVTLISILWTLYRLIRRWRDAS
jgi:hypothetical protein